MLWRLVLFLCLLCVVDAATYKMKLKGREKLEKGDMDLEGNKLKGVKHLLHQFASKIVFLCFS